MIDNRLGCFKVVFELTELFSDEFRREALDEGVIPPAGDPDGQHQVVGGFAGMAFRSSS